MENSYDPVKIEDGVQDEFLSMSADTSAAAVGSINLGATNEFDGPVVQEKSAHPTALFFTLCFKVATLLTYLLCGWFSNDAFVTVFVICIILLAADFWTVKNISGRLLVGLRYWNHIKEDGTSEWMYESAPSTIKFSAYDKRIFWWTLYATPLVWGIMTISAVIGFNLKWLLVTACALTLSGAQLYGYWQCSKDQQTQVKAMAQGIILQQGMNVMTNYATSAVGMQSVV